MKGPKRRRKCLCCKELFSPDARTASRQKYCSAAACRKQSKQQSQRNWQSKAENQNYFAGAEQSARVRAWQQAHPDYWKNTARHKSRTLQEETSEKPLDNQGVKPDLEVCTLQEQKLTQMPLIVGLISMLVDSTLQEDIAATTRRLVAKGSDILGMEPGMNMEKSSHEKTYPRSGAPPENPLPVQLGGSPIG